MAKASASFIKYGIRWKDTTNPLNIEFYCIRNYQAWGLNLFDHYINAQKLLWPHLQHHRWSDLMLQQILNERVTIILGPKDTGKTHVALARFGLTDYFCYPNNTLILVSSTDLRGMETRVFGEIKQMFQSAKELHPDLPGKVADHLHGVFTDELGTNCEVRDMRKGILCVPCVGGAGEWVGIEKFCGIKQERRRLLADELQFMKAPYLTSVEHLDKGDFKMVGCANPIGLGDPADKMSEPVNGWGTEPQSDRTEVWRNKWGGITINLDGRDTPNNDEPKNSYGYLINELDIERTLKRCGPDSSAYWTQVIGKRKVGLLEHRVLTYTMCKMFGAFEEVVWKASPSFKVYGIDASYGGDRCVGGWAEVGEDVNGQVVVSFNEPVLIPIKLSVAQIAEDQIAEFVRKDCEAQNIPPEHVYFDATGRGSLGTSFARLWSPAVNPVEFGGVPTPRPVTGDTFILDPKTRQKRLKRCDEHYSKRVTEYWFSVRYLVEARQCRQMPKDVAEEFGMREWYPVKDHRRELETKEETKKRMGCSPDLADWACIVVEGARRKGFVIRHGGPVTIINNDQWKRDLKEKLSKVRQRYELNYSA